MHDFSYAAYRACITRIQDAIPLKDYREIQASDASFCIVRHDVEFSVEKAYDLAKIESDFLGIQSSYFFQVRNYSYNPCAAKNVSLIKEIVAMGHKIGLHVNAALLGHVEDLAAYIKKDIVILENGLDTPIDRFSFHRPSHEMLASHLKIDGLINTYDPLFFHYHGDKACATKEVHYYSDSEHSWKYGHPLSILNEAVKKMQLLIHPYSWSEQGLDNKDNFKELLHSKYRSMLHAMHDECHNFPEELLHES